MILVDSVFINNGGGKVLLDYLIEHLESENIKIHYLLDERIYKKHPKISHFNKITYIKSGIINRYLFYKKNHNRFSKVLCFGNIPPPIKMKSESYTYFHNYLYFVKTNKNILSQFKLFLKKRIIIFYSKNTNYWIAQTHSVKNGLSSTFKISKDIVLTIPFYKSINNSKVFTKQKYTYLYVSNAYSHKNHIFLIETFCKFYDIFKLGKLILTVDKHYDKIISLINEKVNLGYPIDNLGFINQFLLENIYSKCEYVVYPSLFESFGLGLIEGIEFECKVIASDLSYTYDICYPSITFSPYDSDSLFKALKYSLNDNIKPTLLKVSNKINLLTDIFK
jgi:glycosyltransferase involved in cell wall biosynthesis